MQIVGPRGETERDPLASDEDIAEAAHAETQARASAAPSNAYARTVIPLLVAAVFGAIGEGSASARATGRSGTMLAVSAALDAGLLVLPLFAGVALVLGAVLSRRSIRGLARASARVLTAGRPRLAGVVVVVGLGAAIGVTAAVQALGRFLDRHVSAPIARDAVIAADDVLLCAALFSLAAACPLLARPLARAADRRAVVRAIFEPQGTLCVLALLGAIASLVRLPLTYAATPSSICFGLVVGISSVRGAAIRFGARAAAIALVAAGVSWTAGATMLSRLAPVAQLTVVTRTPYTSLLVGAVRQAVDRDGDGFSPVLLGGDCDDRDARVNPGARDVPGNGFDENCSGEDAHAYAPLVPPPSPRPDLPLRSNIVLVQLDALRPDHTSFAGYRRPTTPNLDAFRASSTWFSRAYSPMPSTRFAIAAVFTGKDGAAVDQAYGGGPDYTLLPQAETVAERLETIGYQRVGLTISYVLHHIHGVEQGFSELATPWPVDAWQATYSSSAQRTTDAALDRLAHLRADAPYFLFVHYQCGHDPYAAQPEWRFGTEPVDEYDSALAYCDREVGRFLRELDARSDRARTGVVVFSDHGELFGEHGLTAHGNSLYEADARALLLARLPGGRKVDRVDAPVSLTDLAPTLLELAGLPPAPGTDPWSLVPYMTPGGTPRPERTLFLGTDLWRGTVHHLSSGVLTGRYKLVRDRVGHLDELFDVVADPEERIDLAPVMPERRARMLEALDEHDGRLGVY